MAVRAVATGNPLGSDGPPHYPRYRWGAWQLVEAVERQLRFQLSLEQRKVQQVAILDRKGDRTYAIGPQSAASKFHDRVV